MEGNRPQSSYARGHIMLHIDSMEDPPDNHFPAILSVNVQIERSVCLLQRQLFHTHQGGE